MFNDFTSLLEKYSLYAKENKQERALEKRLAEINRFVTFYSKHIDKKPEEISLTDLENLPLEIIQTYFTLSKIRLTGQKTILNALSSFWSYLSCHSFTLETKRPLIYRHAFNEWKIGYKATYLAIKEAKPIAIAEEPKLYSEVELQKILDFCDNGYILTLDTDQKARNWEKNKERNLAILALIMGAGLTIEELADASIRDIDMRKKSIIVNRNGELHELPIFEFACPYISPYIARRRSWWLKETGVSSLFLNQKKKPLLPTSIATVLQKLSIAYHSEISSKILKQSHTALVYQQSGNLREAMRRGGHKTLMPLEKII